MSLTSDSQQVDATKGRSLYKVMSTQNVLVNQEDPKANTSHQCARKACWRRYRQNQARAHNHNTKTTRTLVEPIILSLFRSQKSMPPLMLPKPPKHRNLPCGLQNTELRCATPNSNTGSPTAFNIYNCKRHIGTWRHHSETKAFRL